MSTRGLILTTFATVLCAACNPFRSDPAVQMSADDTTLNSRWHANLTSPATLAGMVQISGSGSMAPSPDGAHTDITLALANATPGGLHPWAVHRGQCGAWMDDGVFGRSDAYKPLKVESDGIAEGTATVPVRTPLRGDYSVVVRASEANPYATIACGNLAAPTQ